jgi:pimeloyl-ACP methyl ester carboxylesterase
MYLLFFYTDEDGILTDDSTLLLIHGFPTSSHDWIKVGSISLNNLS